MTKAKRRELIDRASRLYEGGNLEQAEALCREVLSADAKEGEAWFRLGWIARRRDDLERSIEAFRRAVQCERNEARYHNGLGVALMAAGQLAEAVTSYRKALDLRPANADALGNLARAQWLLGDLDAAEMGYRRAVNLGPDLAAARHNYGKLLRFRGKHREAIEEHTRATQLAPDNPEFHLGLGLDYMACHAHARAAECLERAAELRGDDADLVVLLAQELYRAGRWADALRRCEAVLRHGVNPPVRLVLSQCLLRLGRTDEALAECTRVLSEAPDWPTARFVFETMTAPDRVRDVPEEMITALFDDYADLFDDHLVQTLKYRAPQLLLDAVGASSGGRRGLAVMDAGCGTGLCGELFRPIALRLAGVDLSPRMLEKAAARNVYDELLLGDLVDALSRAPAAYDLVVAADVLLYVGDLGPVFAAANGALRDGGIFAFTVEALEVDDGREFVLRPSRRFAHALPYLRATAAEHGLTEIRADEAVLRREAGADVRGFVIVLRK
jgi:predicted TPR repeat methyltransferase